MEIIDELKAKRALDEPSGPALMHHVESRVQTLSPFLWALRFSG